jgi:hypothetical protein
MQNGAAWSCENLSILSDEQDSALAQRVDVSIQVPAYKTILCLVPSRCLPVSVLAPARWVRICLNPQTMHAEALILCHLPSL